MERNIDKRGLIYFGLSLLIFIISFPILEPDFSTGMDASFSWGINYLFDNDFDFLTQVYCTYGPLGFLKKPVAIGNNFRIALGLYTILKVIMITFLFYSFVNKGKWINVIPIIGISLVASLDTIFILLVVLNLWLFTKNKRWYFFVLACLLSVVALYIKPSFGFACLGVIAMYGGIYFFKTYDVKKILTLLCFFILVVGCTSAVLIGEPFYIIKYLSNTFFITSGYSSSLSLFPKNNWIVLLLFILSFIPLPFLTKSKSVKYMYTLMLLPLFIAWKYAMVREDYSHYKFLIDFTILFFLMLFLASKKSDRIIVGLGLIISVFSLLFNATCVEGYNSQYTIKANGFNNIKPWLFSFKEYESSFKENSKNKIESKKLSNKIKNEIKGKSIDVFPWELTYIPANNLKWKPRKSLMSLHMSDKHDQLASNDINIKNGPEYILFHWKKDTMGGSFGSIDFRHLFNDSPSIIYNLFNDYKLSIKDKKVGIFKKRKANILTQPKIFKEEAVKYNEWVKVPSKKQKIIRLKVNTSYNVLGSLKSLFYKGEAFYVEYEMITNEIRKYRFVSTIAKNGLWISPLLKNFDDDVSLSQVKRIRISSSNSRMVNEKVDLKWEEIGLIDSNKSIGSIFSEN